MHDILIEPDGTIQAIYDDEVVGVLASEGESEIRRASHVEPAASIGWECDGWVADMRPVRGPILHDGADRRGVKRAFPTRQAALDAEVAWLRDAMARRRL